MKALWTFIMLAAAGSAAADSLAERLKTGGVFTVGTEGTYPPFTYHDKSGKLTGYDVEVTRAAADKLGVRVQFEETPWNALLAGLNNARFDAAANQISMSLPERREKYISTQPYSYSGAALAVNQKYTHVNGLEDLHGLRGGLAYTSSFADLVRRYGGEVEPVEGGLGQEMKLAAQGRTDFTLNDRLAVLYYRQQMGEDSGLRILDLPEEGKVSAGLVLRKNEEEARQILDEALAELKADGTISRISQQFFGEDVSRPQ